MACNPRQKKITQTYPLIDTIKLKHPKNIILMIGDGMGLTQITAGMYANGNKLNLEKFPTIGLHKSYASDNLVTDSAAGATAFACGVKTYNGAIGITPDSIPVQSILEEAEERGLATGLISTSSITHATPASFIAHQKSRRLYELIAEDFMKTEIDFFVGGGKKYFDRRTDDKDLYSELKKNGYNVHNYFDRDFNEITVSHKKNFVYFTADEEPLPVAQGRDYLVPVCKTAAPFLKKHTDSTGFFLMIEGSQIDWGGHANESDYIITEMIEFDRAIGEMLKFAEKDGETLIIVTADHETGGYAINPGSTMKKIEPGFTTDKHTATLIPVFAYGPGAKLFGGIYENTDIYYRMRMAFGFDK